MFLQNLKDVQHTKNNLDLKSSNRFERKWNNKLNSEIGDMVMLAIDEG